MSVLHVKYLIVGGGVAGSAAAEAIRARDAQGELLLVGREAIRPYHRPPLSKAYLRRQVPRDELFVRPVGWYAEQNIQLRTGVRAAHLDAARRIVTLDNGQEISFDALLLSTGMSPLHLNVPGAELPNIFYLRTLEEAERLHLKAEQARAEGMKNDRGGRGRIVIIGGGVLGVELSATLTQLGLAVDLIVAHAWPWRKFAGDQTGKFLARYLERHGVNVHLNQRVTRVDGDGRVQRVAMSDAPDPLPCDFCIAAVGAAVNKDLLRGTAIRAEKAILVDGHCRTNVQNIFAAGDCAAMFDPLFGKHRVLDHWDNARVTGAIAGANMAGDDIAYDAVNHFFSDVFDLSLLAWGEARQVDRRLMRGSTTVDAPDFLEIGIAADGRVAQVLALNHRGEADLLRALVGQRVRVDGNEERIKDPSFPLATLLDS